MTASVQRFVTVYLWYVCNECATGAKEIVNFEILPPPSNTRAADNPWPQYPRVMRVDYGHEEVRRVYGKDPREYSILSKEFVGNDDGQVTGIKTVKVEWKKDESGQWKMREVPGSEHIFEADMVLLSMGFLGPGIHQAALYF